MKLLSRIADLLFVPRCVFCGKILKEGKICADCIAGLPYFGGLIRGGEFYSCCAAALYYRDTVRKSLLKYKFHGRRSYAGEYAKLLADTITRELSDRYDVITWVPVSARRERERGYDQSRLIAEETAKLLGERAEAMLVKVRHTKAQSSLKGKEKRNANISGAYRAKNQELFRGKRVLLIDDIVTTGSTFSECARTLLMAGADDVVCAAVASAMRN